MIRSAFLWRLHFDRLVCALWASVSNIGRYVGAGAVFEPSLTYVVQLGVAVFVGQTTEI